MAKHTKFYLVVFAIILLWVPQVQGNSIRTAARLLMQGSGGRITQEAAEQSVSRTVRELQRYGSNGTRIVNDPQQLALVSQYGDDATKAIIQHGDNAVVLMQQYGKSAANVMARINQQNGRHLATMNSSGDLAKIGGADEVFAVIEKYGDRGAAFIWNNKGALAVGTVAATFYANPEPFINGAKELIAKEVGSNSSSSDGGGGSVSTTDESVVQPTDKMNGVVLPLVIVSLCIVAFVFRRPLWELYLSKLERFHKIPDEQVGNDSCIREFCGSEIDNVENKCDMNTVIIDERFTETIDEAEPPEMYFAAKMHTSEPEEVALVEIDSDVLSGMQEALSNPVVAAINSNTAVLKEIRDAGKDTVAAGVAKGILKEKAMSTPDRNKAIRDIQEDMLLNDGFKAVDVSRLHNPPKDDADVMNEVKVREEAKRISNRRNRNKKASKNLS